MASRGTLTVQGYDKNNLPVKDATYSKGFQRPGVSTRDVSLTLFDFPDTFPSVYNITLTYTPKLTNALLADNVAYAVSK